MRALIAYPKSLVNLLLKIVKTDKRECLVNQLTRGICATCQRSCDMSRVSEIARVLR